MPDRTDKSFRLIGMYEMLSRGGGVAKLDLAERFGVSEKTIQRDIDDLRAYLAEGRPSESGASIRYDRARNEYALVRFEREWLTNEEVMAISKILLESRAFPKAEASRLMDKLLMQAMPEERGFIRDMIKSELFNYVELRHGKNLLPAIWDLSRMVRGREEASFSYTRQDGAAGERIAHPVALIFSEFYFYLIAYLAGGERDFPAVFRVDRIENIRRTGEKFSVPYHKKFSDGEFRKRVQFMYPGRLERITFSFKGDSIEAVLDRLPTAEIVSESDGAYTVTAEVYGRGIDMWLRSQGDFVSSVRRSEVRKS
ncbi:MAG: WYL domain-containing protein [Synergistaceae bacterium]|nr:WYL domain-containing protein [Synergistaceae bacterium]